jgi:hypothetical protein
MQGDLNKMCIKNLFIRYLLTLLGLSIFPLIIGSFALAAAIIAFPFLPFY